MIIGIGGVSRSGKTSLAKSIQQYIGTKECTLIQQDDFARPLDQLPKFENEIDWEDPAGLDYNQLRTAIENANRTTKHVIVDGFLIFYNQLLTDLFDFSVFVAISKQTFEKRKKEDNRWGTVSDKYIEHIWNSYEKFGGIVNTQIDWLADGEHVETLTDYKTWPQTLRERIYRE